MAKEVIENTNRLVDVYDVLAQENSLTAVPKLKYRSYQDGTWSANSTDVLSKLSEILGSIEPHLAPQSSRKGRNIFIGHGRKMGPLERVERFIEALGHNPLVVKEQPSKGKSIGQAVEGYLQSSECAILIFTAEVEKEGAWHAGENVINEEGLSRKYVGERIIYLVEQGVTLPTNFKEKVYGSFQENDMTDAFIKIARELKALGML